MSIDVSTRDCLSLGDAELAEIAELCEAKGTGFDIGFLSKQREEWVLCSDARENGSLIGVAFCTLERIGGTPCILVGLAASMPGEHEKTILFELMAEQYRKALLAFPDEDVLVGVRMASRDGYTAFAGLEDIVPRPDHKPTGEERAWARRISKRFGAESKLDDRSFVIKGDGGVEGYLGYGRLELRDDDLLSVFFSDLKVSNFDTLVAFGWAMAERLAEGSLPGDEG